MFRAANIHYEMADRVRGLAYGGIGAMHFLARKTGLVEAIDDKLKLLKLHLPYHESDHVLNIAYNILCNSFIQLPCQIIKTGRKIVYRLLSWNPWLGVFFRGFWGLRYSPG